MIAGDIRSGLEMRTKFHERRAAKKKKGCALHCSKSLKMSVKKPVAGWRVDYK